MATTQAERIASLDVIRGIAVMGIFSVNVVGMGMIERAYFNPPDFGLNGVWDRIVWAANFIFIDGRLRGLFSILFGASMLLVIERGAEAGREPWAAHYPRMAVLLVLGLAHYYLLWWGDILANYALVGMVAFLFWRMPAGWLLATACAALALMYVPMISVGNQQMEQVRAMAAPDATPEQQVRIATILAGPTAQELAQDKQAHATLADHVAQMTEAQNLSLPFQSVFGYGIETLGLMLLGMAGYRSGFLTGAWPRRRYWLVAAICCGASIGYFSWAAWRSLATDFDFFTFTPLSRIWSWPLHPVGAVGYAALIILAMGKGPLTGSGRVAAAGRMALSNYIGCTLLGMAVFYDHGLGLYADLSRGQIWLFAPLGWLLMLAWSKPWLARFRYGPLEWLWRSLSRWQWEKLRR